MSFSGNGAGRFQIRRLRNGSTAESLIAIGGPTFQDFAEPTGQHSPNWDNREEAGDIANHPSVTTNPTGLPAGTYTEFSGGLFRLISGGTQSTAPTAGQTDDNWEYEGPIAVPLTLSPVLLVNGVTVDTTPAFTRAASPVNALVTDIEWYVLRTGTAGTISGVAPIGNYERVNTSTNGFSITNDVLSINRNLDTTTDWNTGALQDNMLHIRCRISYNITGVLDAANNLQTLTSDSFITVRRNILTESSMFARIYLREIDGQSGSSSQIWNSGFTGDKTFRADLIIGANIANDSAAFDVTYQWHDSDGAISGQTSRDLTRTRAQVLTAETYHCLVTDVHTGMVYTTNSIELRDFLDPIQFVEVGTATIDTGSGAMLTVIPYQNGAMMSGLTAANTAYRFEISRQGTAVDMTGTRIAWVTSTPNATRAPGQTAPVYSADTNPALTNGIVTLVHNTTINGATLGIADAEVGAHGAFINYDVMFTNIAN